MNMFGETDELSIFMVQMVEDLITFKWSTYARRTHSIGAFMHFFYLTVFTVYIHEVYIQNRSNINYDADMVIDETSGEVEPMESEGSDMYIILLTVGIAYPFTYDTIQQFRLGQDYWTDPWNYTDFALNISGLVNIIL